MTALVTGAAGHLGNNVVRALLAQGREVRVLVHATGSSLDGLAVERHPGDVLDRSSLDGPFAGVDAVYHFAGLVSLQAADGPRVHATNVAGTRNVVAACLAHRVRKLVHGSSIHALAPGGRDEPTDESRPPNLDRHATPYDRSKVGSEAEVREGVARGLDAVILNPTGVIGPHDYVPRLAGRALIDMYLRRLPIGVAGGFDWVDARDVAAGALAAESRGRAGERYVLSGRWASMRELASIMREQTGRAGPRLTAPLWLAWLGLPFLAAYAQFRASHPLYTAAGLRALTEHRRCRNDKARRELGFSPRPLERTLADTFAFYERAGLLAPGATRGQTLPAGEFP